MLHLFFFFSRKIDIGFVKSVKAEMQTCYTILTYIYIVFKLLCFVTLNKGMQFKIRPEPVTPNGSIVQDRLF